MIIRTQHYNKVEQYQRKFYKTFDEAKTVAKRCGEEFEAVKAVDSYFEMFLGYAVEHK